MKRFDRFFLFHLSFVFLFQSGIAQNLVKGPYVQDVRKDRATVCWVTQEAEVKFGTSPNNLQLCTEEIKVHEIILENLEPNTTYYYDIGFGQAGKGHLKTAPEYGTSFQFVVVGDTRFANQPREIQAKLITAIEKQNPSFVINTGDLVTDGTDPSHWDTFFKMNQELIKSTPYYVSLGNHEKNSKYFYQYFSFPKNENYFSFNWSNCHFVILDSEGPHYEPEHPLDYQQRKTFEKEMNTFWEKQLTWLCDDLKNHREFDFTLVFMHQPLFSLKDSRREEQKEFQKRFAQIFEDFEVDIVFSGHDHNYQRHFVKPVHYIVTAGGGAGLYDMGKPFLKYTRKISKKHHYVLVKVDGKKLTSTALTEDGDIIEQFTIPFDDNKDKKRAVKELRLQEEGTYDTWF